MATLNELMIAYELFALVDPPHAREKTQQTPNDEAHVPDEEPPFKRQLKSDTEWSIKM